ncbi:hypothetical protein B0H19DRAFT_383109 [Mycena capillaripes]|nr:hypothetical protein B0H19DRAFT_383109 [Mycena capillaripes]
MIPTVVALVLSAFLAWSSGGQVHAVLTNTTIDDTDFQHWSYGTLQQGAWTSVTAQTLCPNCSAQPDPTKVVNQSWHDGYRTTGAFAFQGSAVYIYGIDWFDDSNVTFAMENPPLTGFHYWRGSGYVYDVLFFSATGLDPTVQHIVTWVNTPGEADNGSMLFDYALVTVDQPQSSSASGSSTSPLYSFEQYIVAIKY